MSSQSDRDITDCVFVVLLKRMNSQPPKVLLQLRENTGIHDGKFRVPGGKRHNKEPWLETAARELLEETGCAVDKGAFRKLCRRMNGKCLDGTKWRSDFYVAERWRGEPRVREPEKHGKVEWHPINDLPENIVLPVREALARIWKSLSAEWIGQIAASSRVHHRSDRGFAKGEKALSSPPTVSSQDPGQINAV
jgi:8-oxo-dGTP pyrophosphatase MutT (NUDIX family)